MPRANISRRSLLKTTGLAAAGVLSAPYVRHSHAAGKLALGVWDHWVPGANNTLTRLCNEWGEKNKVEVTIDYQPDSLVLAISDNGSGATERVGAYTGHGLIGMRERAALHGGQLTAGPASGGGFAVRVKLPTLDGAL